MKSLLLIPSLLVFPLTAFAGAELSQVLFDPIGTDTGLEWVKVVNSGAEQIDMSGWQLYPDGVGYFVFPNSFTLKPNSSVLIYVRTSGTNTDTKLYHSSATGNMGNTSGSVALFSAEARNKETLKSFVEWGKAGQTWESTAVDAGLWTKGTSLTLPETTEGLALTNNGGTWKWISPDSQGLNAVAGSSATTSPQETRTVSLSAWSSADFPTLRAFAGEDRVEAVGSIVRFEAKVLGINNEPLENARFWWNFGDGDSKEGKLITHSFSVPGTYTVGLHTSSGNYAGSDFLTVVVQPNQVVIKNVVPGEDGYVTLENSGGAEIDIGEWLIGENEKFFSIPSQTKIASHAHVAFTNRLTSLFKNPTAAISATLRYPNSTVAGVWNPESSKILPVTAVSIPSTQVKQLPLVAEKEIQNKTIQRTEGTSTPLQTVVEKGATVTSNSSIWFFSSLGLSFAAAAGFLVFRLFF